MRLLIASLTLATLLVPVVAQAQDPLVPTGMRALCLTSNWQGLEAPLVMETTGSARLLAGSASADSRLVRTPAIALVPEAEEYGIAIYSRIPTVEFMVRDCTPDSVGGAGARWLTDRPVGGFVRSGPRLDRGALVLLDGTRVSRDQIDNLAKGALRSVQILTPPAAIGRFGPEGQFGAVILTSRDAAVTSP